jgi:DNA-binding protein HU-beta
VNKTELIRHIAKNMDISSVAAARALEATIGAVKTTLKRKQRLVVGLQYIAVGKRAAVPVNPALAMRLKSRRGSEVPGKA